MLLLFRWRKSCEAKPHPQVVYLFNKGIHLIIFLSVPAPSFWRLLGVCFERYKFVKTPLNFNHTLKSFASTPYSGLFLGWLEVGFSFVTHVLRFILNIGELIAFQEVTHQPWREQRRGSRTRPSLAVLPNGTEIVSAENLRRHFWYSRWQKDCVNPKIL